jgi:hypothetical protein
VFDLDSFQQVASRIAACRRRRRPDIEKDPSKLSIETASS